MNDPDLREPEATRIPSQLWQPWTLVIPALLLLPMLGVAFSWQISPSSDDDLRRPIHHYPRGSQMPEPEPTPEPAPAATQPPVAAMSQFTMFVPGDDGMLHPKTFRTIGGSGTSDFVSSGTNALKNLFAAAPEYFPAGTQLRSLSQDESDPSLVNVTLNDKFWHSDYWAGETRADMATQAIAHTLDAAFHKSGGQGPVHVHLVGDDPETTMSLGEFDTRVPFTSDLSMVAKTGKSSHTTPVTKH
jgi:hypothetical protein